MKPYRFLLGIAALVVLFAVAAGCTSTTSAPSATAVPTIGTTAAPVTSSAVATAQATATPSGIDTKVQVHFNDYTCMDIQDGLGVEYLYPDEKYTVWATTPGSISPNLLVVDVTDNTKFVSVKPAWDAVHKIWVYDGLVPLVKIFDISSPQTRTLTIKNQGKYYLCIDDRKETGTSDEIYQVPVKVTRA
ncbi:MAG: hypothetical protein WC367_07980 [Methanoregula sp.]|jgi:hypothetical protein